MTHVTGRNVNGMVPPRIAALGSTVLLVSANALLRAHVAQTLRGLRWTVQEAGSGAQAWLRQEDQPCGAVLLDEWLPDLTAADFARQFLQEFPTVDAGNSFCSGHPQHTAQRAVISTAGCGAFVRGGSGCSGFASRDDCGDCRYCAHGAARRSTSTQH